MDLNSTIREHPLGEPELSHAATTLKTATKKNFKYIAKVENGGATRYFYTQEEYDAYLKDQKSPKESSASSAPTASPAAKTTTKKTPPPGKMSLAGMLRAGLKAVEEQTKKAEQAAEEAKKKAEENEKMKADILAKQASVDEKRAEVEADEKPDEKPQEPELSPEDKKAYADAISRTYSPKTFDQLDRKEGETDSEFDQERTNPNHLSYTDLEYLTDEERAILKEYEEETGIGIEEYQNNCASCSVAYDLRRRGYDVEAAPYDMNETWRPNVEGVSSLYKDVTKDDWAVLEPNLPQGFENFRSTQLGSMAQTTLDDMPDGSYGQFNMTFDDGSGHSVVWEKVDGKITLRDCQSNVSYDFDFIEKGWYNIPYYSSIKRISILRTDDKEPSDQALKRVRNASDENPIADVIKAVKARAAAGGPTPDQQKAAAAEERKKELEKLERELEDMRKEAEKLEEERRRLEEKRKAEEEKKRRLEEETKSTKKAYGNREVSIR